MSVHNVKAMLDDISINVPEHLRRLKGVTNVQFLRGGTGASVSAVAAWDEVRACVCDRVCPWCDCGRPCDRVTVYVGV